MTTAPEKALCIFYTPDKRILLQDRHGHSKVGEEWGFFGGSIEPGETPEQAVIREIEEELSYHPTAVTNIGTVQHKIPGYGTFIAHLFLSPMPAQGADAMTVHEGRGMELFSIADARTLKIFSGVEKAFDVIENALKTV